MFGSTGKGGNYSSLTSFLLPYYCLPFPTLFMPLLSSFPYPLHFPAALTSPLPSLPYCLHFLTAFTSLLPFTSQPSSLTYLLHFPIFFHSCHLQDLHQSTTPWSVQRCFTLIRATRCGLTHWCLGVGTAVVGMCRVCRAHQSSIL